MEQKGSIWFVIVSPKTPDLPILDCYCTKSRLQSETGAIAEAKSRVDKALAGCFFDFAIREGRARTGYSPGA